MERTGFSENKTTQNTSARTQLGRTCIRFWWGGSICWNTPDPWYPSGTIKLWDDRLNNYYPMQGVRVRAS
jgi:hypothetical protein